jgi:hypothetical protein
MQTFRKQTIGKTLLGALLALTSFCVLPANASPLPITTVTDNVTLNPDVSGVTDIAIITSNSLGVGVQWSYSLSPNSSSFSADVGTATPLQGTLAIGIATDLPGDPSGVTTNHLVVLGNFTPSQIAEGYGLFPGTDEGEMISDLQSVFCSPNGVGACPAYSPGAIQYAFTYNLQPFALDAEADGLFVPNDSSLDVVAFSSGQLIGTGFSSISVPEPMTLSLFGAGAVGVCALRRKKKKTT